MENCKLKEQVLEWLKKRIETTSELDLRYELPRTEREIRMKIRYGSRLQAYKQMRHFVETRK